MKYEYKTSGVCSKVINFEIENGIITDVNFVGGCNGNLQGISALVIGQRPEEVIKKILGIKCGFKNTSCPDQFALALEQTLYSK